MKPLLKIYHSLPTAIWPLLASIKAYSLKRRRYGSLYLKALPQIQKRQFWEQKRWEDFQKQQLREVLKRAVNHVPAYAHLADVLNTADGNPLNVLMKWPLLNVDHFRKNPDLYRDREIGFKGCISLFTSGTSGSPKKIVRDPRAEQLNYAYFEARWRNNAGVKLGDRWALIGGQLIAPVQRNKPPFWVAAYPMNQLYLSSYHLKPEFAESYMSALKNWQPKYIYGYASSLNMLAQFSEQTGIGLNLTSIISNAEPLYDTVREKLKKVFKCKIFDTYGGTEGVFQGFECSDGRMHISPDFGVFEILRTDGSQCQSEELGQVVVTGLTNRAMPLIRYPVGDSAIFAKPGVCSCGCSFPVLERIEGRSDDLIELPDGRIVGRLDPVFKAEFPMKEAQIVQKRDSSIEVFVVKENGEKVPRNNKIRHCWNNAHEKDLLVELRARLGKEIPIKISYVEQIPRGANNKFKAVVREKV